MATYLNPASEIFIPYQNYFLPPPYHHHHLQVTPSSSYSSYPPLPLPYYKTYSAPPTTTTSPSFPSRPAIIPVFSTSTATCPPPPSSNYYQYSSLSPESWYGSTNTYPSSFQPFLPISKFQTYVYDHQMYGSTSAAVEEVEKNVVLEENLKNPPTADDIPKKGRVGMGKKKMYIPPRLGGSRHHHHQPANVKYNQKRMIWKPKSVTSNDHNGVSTTSDYDRVMNMLLPSRKLVDEECDSTQNNSHETTLMIRNIPIKYTREMLMNLLEEHCKEVNEIRATESEVEKVREDERLSAFDFLYLPIDFKTGCNKGYAFVNMVNSIGAKKLKLFLTDYKWGVYESKKICKISQAKIQGKEALVKRFENCYFRCDSDKLLPLCFSPYRDGSGGFLVESTVGKCCGPRLHQNEADGDHKLTSE